MKSSIGIQIVWSIALKETLIADFEHIQREHFFIGLLKFSEMKAGQIEIIVQPPELIEEISLEQKSLIEFLTSYGISIPELSSSIRRRIRIELGYGGYPHGKNRTIHRSKEARDDFAKAGEIAKNKSSEEYNLIHLSEVLLGSRSKILIEVLKNLQIPPVNKFIHVFTDKDEEPLFMEPDGDERDFMTEEEKSLDLAVLNEVYSDEEDFIPDGKILKRIARHYAGHCLIACLNGNPPAETSIIGQSYKCRYTEKISEDKWIFCTKPAIENFICEAMAGRAAEIIYYGNENGLSTGASEDLKKATLWAKLMIGEFGMTRDFGQVYLDKKEFYDGPAGIKINIAAEQIIREQLEKAIKILEENRKYLNKLSKRLFEKNRLTREEMKKILP